MVVLVMAPGQYVIMMGKCERDVTHWSYIFLALTHRFGQMSYWPLSRRAIMVRYAASDG